MNTLSTKMQSVLKAIYFLSYAGWRGMAIDIVQRVGQCNKNTINALVKRELIYLSDTGHVIYLTKQGQDIFSRHEKDYIFKDIHARSYPLRGTSQTTRWITFARMQDVGRSEKAETLYFAIYRSSNQTIHEYTLKYGQPLYNYFKNIFMSAWQQGQWATREGYIFVNADVSKQNFPPVPSMPAPSYNTDYSDSLNLTDNDDPDDDSESLPIPTLAEIAWKHLITATRSDGEKFYKFSDDCPENLSGIIRDAAYAIDTSLDSAYEESAQILEAIAQLDPDIDPDDIFDEIVSDLSPDVYTADLQRWLISSLQHGEYMTRAIEEFEVKDYFTQLTTAQTLYLEELANALIDELKNID